MSSLRIESLAEELARVGRDAVARGLVVGSGGNLSARLPGSDEILVTGAGTWLDRLDQSSFSRVRLSDARPRPDRAGGGIAPSTEVALHREVYRVRPDVNAVIHLHPQSTVLLDAVGEPIRLITTDHAFYLRRIATTPVYRPGTTELAEAAAAVTVDGTNCVILPHHGCCVLGPDIAMAWRRAANLEEAARLTYRALLLTGGLPGRSIAECPITFESADTV